MKRELKFRAFDYGKMIYQNQTIMTDNIDQLWFFFKNIRKDAMIMQSTLLIDRNGKEIYEGDIVKWGMHKHSKEHYHRYAIVEINPDIKFKIIFYIDSKTKERKVTDNYKFNYGSFAYKDTENHLEVIGNIYENPELL
jgi:uncharacterized phage protein (TIGR01671 family)